MKILFLLLISVSCWAQVANDAIENRIQLFTSEAALSTTTDCTVQQECVDESLTGKCITYHNDQWFSYYSDKEQHLYINIYGQSCRDLRGIQLVVIEGTPCETSTYKLLSCTSLATQDNFYVEFNVEQNKEYLLNVDGYLHDHCRFFIAVDTVSYGFPTLIDFPLTSISARRTHDILLQWSLPDTLSLKIKHFEIHRRKYKDVRFEYLNSIDVQTNAYGVHKSEYEYIDTLKNYRKVYYKLVAIDVDNKTRLINEFEF